MHQQGCQNTSTLKTSLLLVIACSSTFRLVRSITLCCKLCTSHPGYFPDFKKSFWQSCIHIEHLTSCSLCTVTVWRWGYANLTFLWRALRSSFNIADAMMKFKIHEHGGFPREGFHCSEYIIGVQCSSNWEKHHDYSIHPCPHFVVR